MRHIKKLFKDRKILYFALGIMLISLFTLTVVYAALSTVLEIQGTAEVSAAAWDIHFANPKVKNGSVTSDVPMITGSTQVSFSTVLNTPGDFYEFTVDVVNDGTIDALIDSVVKTPELTSDQAKYIKYEVSYANDISISTKQIVYAGTYTPLKVRVEYRKDINNNDLPSGNTELDLKLTVVYTQSDGSGSSVENNGVFEPVSIDGDPNDIGSVVTIGTEQFYTIGTEGNNVKLLSMYNLYVGGEYYKGEFNLYGDAGTGMQDSSMTGLLPIVGTAYNGITAFSNDNQKGTDYSDYNGSIVEMYVNNYKNILEQRYDINIEQARIINEDEVVNTFGCNLEKRTCSNTSNYDWFFATTYWTDISYDTEIKYYVYVRGELSFEIYNSYTCGVRPVVVISKDYFS